MVFSLCIFTTLDQISDVTGAPLHVEERGEAAVPGGAPHHVLHLPPLSLTLALQILQPRAVLLHPGLVYPYLAQNVKYVFNVCSLSFLIRTFRFLPATSARCVP